MKLIGLILSLSFLCAAAPATQPDVTAACNKLLAEWRDRLAEEHFTAVVASPFVIAGDGGTRKIERYRDATILAAQRALQATYFQKQSAEPIFIVLFESDESYRRLGRKWFDETDLPHFGMFRHDKVMLMNVATGTGTLVHELVHALMQPDFPQAPSWFNEGLASLYEQSSINGDSITGLVNWRLPALKKAITEQKLRRLDELISDPHFYRADLTGLNYAQSRYLMMYLQEKGKLRDYYTQFRDNHADDPTGQKTLERLIAPQSLDEFEQEWRAWVLTL